MYAARFPMKVAAYVGVSQVADMREGERVSYEFARSEAARRGDRRATEPAHFNRTLIDLLEPSMQHDASC